MKLAELAAFVRDVKPESDVHSNLPNHMSPLEEATVSMLQFLQQASSSDQLTFWPDESLSARREPQCPTKASVPDESKLELVQLAPHTAPRTAPRTTPRIRKLI